MQIATVPEGSTEHDADVWTKERCMKAGINWNELITKEHKYITLRDGDGSIDFNFDLKAEEYLGFRILNSGV